MVNSPERRFNVAGRLFFFGCVVLGGLGILLTKLYYEQVVRHEYWAGRISNHSEVTVRIPSVRGEIRDRNGQTLAENRPSYAIELYLPDIVRNYRESKGKVPTVEYLATVRQMKKVLNEPDIVQIVNESVMPRLGELGLAEDYNSVSLQRHFRNKQGVLYLPRGYRFFDDRQICAKLALAIVPRSGTRSQAGAPLPLWRARGAPARLRGRGQGDQPGSETSTISPFTNPISGANHDRVVLRPMAARHAGAQVLRAKGDRGDEVERIEPKQGANVYPDSSVAGSVNRRVRVARRGHRPRRRGGGESQQRGEPAWLHCFLRPECLHSSPSARRTERADQR